MANIAVLPCFTAETTSSAFKAGLLPPLLAIRCSQAKRQPPFLNLKLFAPCFGVLVRHSAVIWVLLCKGGHPLLQVGVVSIDGDSALGFIEEDFCGFLSFV